MPEYTAYIYDGEPGNEVELNALLGDPPQTMLVDLPLELSQLPGTRVMFWQDGKRWIKTAQALIDDVFVLFVRLAKSSQEETAWAKVCDSDLCEVLPIPGNPLWN